MDPRRYWHPSRRPDARRRVGLDCDGELPTPQWLLLAGVIPLRIGGPLTTLVMLMATFLIPRIWPL